jgi:alkylated DNA repair protein alkB family protein 6
MKLTFDEIRKRIKEKPKVVVPRSYNFSYFRSQQIDLSSHVVDKDLWVVRDYVSREMEELLLEYGAYNSPFTVVRDRRVQMYGGKVTPEGLVDKTALPMWTDIFAQRLFDERIFPLKPNHVLVNEYKAGEGIMAHTDGPAYFPLVAILSLGCDSVMEFWKDGSQNTSVFLPQRSLLLFTGDYYYEMLHSIERRTSDLVLSDSCGNYLQSSSGLIPIQGNLPARHPHEGEENCPKCSSRFPESYTNLRETRISLTIRYVPLKF